MESTGNGVVDFGRFLTGFLVVMGIGKSTRHGGWLEQCARTFACRATRRSRGIVAFGDRIADKLPALPTLLWHSAQIAGGAAAMSVFGGLLIYATIMSFTLFFQEQEDF